jgi:uncharacterized protein (TIGR03066 family)
LLLAGGGTFTAWKFFNGSPLPAGLVGKWEVQQGPMAGATFEFFPDGKLETRHGAGDTQINLKAHVVAEGKTLLMTTQDPRTRREQTRKVTVRELTGSALVLALEDGTLLKMVRAKNRSPFPE